MNYYEHHIRDYDAATAHLSWDEDLAYTRLIRWYYRKEQPIPADIKEACRQVRATSKTQRDAVEAVLREFFELRDDGWHQNTCDEVIAAFQAGEPEREVKKANEENRLKKHRLERATLFKRLTDAGQHATWNIRIDELRELVAKLPATAPETQSPPLPATAPATPATATQTPDTRHQTPKVKTSGTDVPGGNPPAMKPDEIIFGYGVPLLTNAGTAEKQARSFLGGLRKAHGDAAVIDKLRECMRAKPLQPLEWLAKALPPDGVMGHSKQTQLESRNAAVAAAWVPPEMRKEATA